MNDLWAPVVYQAVLMPVIFDSEYFKRILLLQFISANSCANFSESVHQRVIFRTLGMNTFDILFTKQSQSMSINLADVCEQENVCKNSQGVCKFANLGLQNFISCLAICKGIRQALHSLREFLNLCCKMSTGLEKCLQNFATMFPAIGKCLQCMRNYSHRS